MQTSMPCHRSGIFNRGSARSPKLTALPLAVLDPVMGDNGQLYVQLDVIPLYRQLMKYAKAITPNQFEAEYVYLAPYL